MTDLTYFDNCWPRFVGMRSGISAQPVPVFLYQGREWTLLANPYFRPAREDPTYGWFPHRRAMTFEVSSEFMEIPSVALSVSASFQPRRRSWASVMGLRKP